MENLLSTNFWIASLFLFITALIGFLIGYLMKISKLENLKKSLDACYKANENLKKEAKKNS